MLIPPFTVVTATCNEQHLDSWLPRAIPAVFLAYNQESTDKTYVCLNLETGRVISTGDTKPLHGAKVSREAWHLLLGDTAKEQIAWKKFDPLDDEKISSAIDYTTGQRLNDIMRSTPSGVELISDRKQMRAEGRGEFGGEGISETKTETTKTRCGIKRNRVEEYFDAEAETAKRMRDERAAKRQRTRQTETETNKPELADESKSDDATKVAGNPETEPEEVRESRTNETKKKRVTNEKRRMSERIRMLWDPLQPKTKEVCLTEDAGDVESFMWVKLGQYQRVALPEEIPGREDPYDSIHLDDNHGEIFLTENVLTLKQALKSDEDRPLYHKAMQGE